MEGTVLEVADCVVMLQGDEDENLLGKVIEQAEKERASENVTKLAPNSTSSINHTSETDEASKHLIETKAEITETVSTLSKPPESTCVFFPPEVVPKKKTSTGEKRKSSETESVAAPSGEKKKTPSSLKSSINWECYEGGDTEYFLRWSVKGDALLRRWNKVTDKNSKLILPRETWKALVLCKKEYTNAILVADQEYIESDLNIEDQVLLELPEDWVILLHTYSDCLYVGLLKKDPTDPSLILAGVGMNFYPEDYFKLLVKLSERTEIEAAAKNRKRQKRRQTRI